MVQPATMKKVHSVDYTADSGREQQRHVGGSSSGSISGGASSGRPGPLMHSVSIVVELAKEPAGAFGSSLDQLRQRSTRPEEVSQTGAQQPADLRDHSSARQQQAQQLWWPVEGKVDEKPKEEEATARQTTATSNKGAAAATANDAEEKEDEEEEEEEDDDDGGCLSTNLARKVVIVDEADKILRSRAQSAEPHELRYNSELILSSLDGGGINKSNNNDKNSSSSRGDNADHLNRILEDSSVVGRVAVGGISSATPTTATSSSGNSSNTSEAFTRSMRSNTISATMQDYLPMSVLATTSGAMTITATGLPQPLLTSAAFSKHQLSPATCSSGIGGTVLASGTTTTTAAAAATSTTTTTTAAAAASGAAASGMGGSSGELAERGELSKLGMRRNTHHHVNFNPSLGSSAGSGAVSFSSSAVRSAAINHPIRQHARSGSAQLEQHTVRPLLLADALSAGTGASNSKAAAGGFHQQQHQHQLYPYQQQQAQGPSLSPTSPLRQIHQRPVSPLPPLSPSSSINKNWPQRRQSLQISLLTGAGCCSSSSKSLTEEELRGEREFNEQVRNSKSPDIFAYRASVASASHHQPFQLNQAATVVAQQPYQQQHQQQRCRSVAGSVSEIVGFADFEAELKQRHQLQQQQQQQQQQQVLQQQQQRQSRRRVSFSSIDPILARTETQQQSQSQWQSQSQHWQWQQSQQQQLQLQRHGRASFAFYPLSHYSSSNANQNSEHSDNNTASSTSSALHFSNPSRLASSSSPDPTSTTGTINSSLQVTSGGDGSVTSPTAASGKSSLSGSTTETATTQRGGCTTLDKQKRHSLATTTTGANYASATLLLGNIQPATAQQQKQALGSGQIPQEAQRLTGCQASLQRKQQHNLIGRQAGDEKKLITQQRRTSIASSASALETTTSINRTNETTAKEAAREKINDSNNSFVTKDTLTRLETSVEPQMEQFAQTKGALGSQEKTPTDDNTVASVDQQNDRRITSSSTELTTATTATTTTTQVTSSESQENADNSRVRSIMANARLRQEEFARLLEEHEQIVNEINRVETKISSSQTNLQQENKQ